MKKISYLLCLLFISAVQIVAQKNKITDNFDSNKFRWEENYRKDYIIGLQNGFLILENESDKSILSSVTELPMDVERNFTITSKIFVPKIKDDYYFGILLNYSDQNNYYAFAVSEGHCKLIKSVNGVVSIARETDIILEKGSKKEVEIIVERKGKKLIFSVNKMEFLSVTVKEIEYNAFGYFVEGNNKIQVDEISIEQLN